MWQTQNFLRLNKELKHFNQCFSLSFKEFKEKFICLQKKGIIIYFEVYKQMLKYSSINVFKTFYLQLISP